LKALCEQQAEADMPGQVANIRPGLIVGPDDDTDRFTYWPVRIAEGGEVLAPGKPEDPVQIIDVRDLANFVIHCIEKSTVGVMNATGPDKGMPIAKMLEACKAGTKSDARFTYGSDEFLKEQRISGWSDLPVWVSPREPGGGLSSVSVAKAVAAGLAFRPVADTARDTLDWFKTTQQGRALRGGLTREREKTALAALNAKQGSGGGPK
jgi:2'-hydroxyisoflavone reductase